MKKYEKIRRKGIIQNFNCYHAPLITASRYVKREAEVMFQEIYIDIAEYWNMGGAIIRVYVMHNGKMYRSCKKLFSKEIFDNMYKRGISPKLYCQALLACEVFDLYTKILSKEDTNSTW